MRSLSGNSLASLRSEFLDRVRSLIVFDLILKQTGSLVSPEIFWSSDLITMLSYLNSTDSSFARMFFETYKNTLGNYFNKTFGKNSIIIESMKKNIFIIPVVIPKLNSISFPTSKQDSDVILDLSRLFSTNFIKALILGGGLRELLEEAIRKEKMETKGKETTKQQEKKEEETTVSAGEILQKIFKEINLDNIKSAVLSAFGNLPMTAVSNFRAFSQTLKSSPLEYVWSLKSPKIFKGGSWTKFDVNMSIFYIGVLAAVNLSPESPGIKYIFVGDEFNGIKINKVIYFDLLRLCYYIYFYKIFCLMIEATKYPSRMRMLLFVRKKSNLDETIIGGRKFLQRYASIVNGFVDKISFLGERTGKTSLSYFPTEISINVGLEETDYYVFSWDWTNYQELTAFEVVLKKGSE